MPDNSLDIYKASAGSGKTYTLTREYLRLALRPGTGPRNILAITFTNAASADMKRKIVEALAKLASGTYHDWEKLLWKGDTRESLQKRAWGVLRKILHQYQDFSVKTIDSFVQNLIKPFAFELGLPQNYTPDVEEERLSEEITQRIIDECGRPGMETLTDLLRRFLELRNEQGKSLDIAQSLQQVVNLLFSERSFEALESMKGVHSGQFNDIIANIKALREEFETKLTDLLDKGRRIIEENGLEAKDFHEGKNGIYSWFCKERTEKKPDARTLKSFADPGNKVRTCIEKGILKKTCPAAGELLDIRQDLAGLDIEGYLLSGEVQNSIYALALVSRAEEILQEIKETTSVIPISEFNKRIDQALSDENNNFIFERSGARYKHIFIDEFQDTSRLQWKNLKPLLEENLSQGNECLIVGDPKQSIYRFRNADMEQFVDLCQGKGNMPVSLQNLQSNWRSERGIIAFNNAFYRFIAETTDGLAPTVLKHHEQFFKNQTDALPQADPEAVRLYLAKDMNGECLQEWYLKETLQIARRFKPGEVTILCRKRKHCTLVADYLIANGIPVSTPDSLVLSAHEGLKLVMHTLRYIESRHVFHKGMCFLLARQMGIWPQEGTGTGDLHEEWKSRKTKAVFASLAALAKEQADVYDTVEAVLRFWGMENGTDQYMFTFLDSVLGGNFPSISSLIEWWDEYAQNTPVCPVRNPECVNVMTVHKSKGLEFDVVVMPFIGDNRLDSQDLFWTSPGILPREIGLPAALVRYVGAVDSGKTGQDMAHEKQLIEIDNLNVLYVATTRPRKKLFLLCTEPSSTPKQFHSAHAICQFAGLHPEYVEKTEDGSVLLPQNDAAATEGNMSETRIAQAEQTAGNRPAKNPSSLDSWRNRMQAARFNTEESTPEMEWGNFIHAVLSKIDTADETSLREALQAGLNEYPQFRSRKEQACGLIRHMLGNPLLEPYFSREYHIKSEAGIAGLDEKIHIPDRVAIKDNRAVVIDYKTGSAHKEHAGQVRQYMELLEKMGLECRKGFIVYIGEEPKVEEVS